jgi:starch synthase (maltosyl-transferring)
LRRPAFLSAEEPQRLDVRYQSAAVAAGKMQDRSAASANSDIDESAARRRVIISDVSPRVEEGRYPAKLCVGETLHVEANIFSDGHGELSADLEIWPPHNSAPTKVAMRPMGNDRWIGKHPLTVRGVHTFNIVAWRDDFSTWLSEAKRRVAAGQSLDLEFPDVEDILTRAISETQSRAAEREFREIASRLGEGRGTEERMSVLSSAAVVELFRMHGARSYATSLDLGLRVTVERKRAGFGAWYELMPRSVSGDAGRHGTFDDVIEHLPYVRDMGFDVLYFPPIHPIGTTHRKGRNNSLTSEKGDPGSLYAIGSPDGGHDAIHSELGNFDDFAKLIKAAEMSGLEIALDFAVQCSPDHPWIKDHPEWFEWRSDNSIRFAENPPKQYEDIVNVQFYGPAFPQAWLALRDIVLFWIRHGVKIFRVDNPHTKPFPFWEWLIGEVHAHDPDVIFLSEAFTRPNVMRHLAKIGFSQSYSYFTWRNTKQELTEYITELTRGPSRAYMRPNFFVNTPDINPYYLQTGGRAAFQVRLILAATLGTNYGMYSGFELCEADALAGKEEYANSEKYELKTRDWDRPGHIRADISRINGLRHSSAALQEFSNVSFYNAWDDNIIYYGKATADLTDFLLFAINLDPFAAHGAHFEIPLWEFGLSDEGSVDVEDLVSGQRYIWTGKVQHILLDPAVQPYAIWRLRPQGAPA